MIEAWSDAEIVIQRDHIVESIDALEYENDMYSNFLHREQGNFELPSTTEEDIAQVLSTFLSNLNDLQSVVAALLEKNNVTVSTASQQKSSSRSKQKTSAASAGAVLRDLNKISMEQKCIVANYESEEIERGTADLCAMTEREIDGYRAVIEGFELKCKDIGKSHCDFERDMKSTVTDRTQKYQSEKIQRYFEEKGRAKEALVKKLRLKTQSMALQKRKVQQQLRQKAEVLGVEVLHEVDWDQIEIENKQYLQKMEDKNVDLLALKQKAAITTALLNGRKRHMQELNEKTKQTNQEIDFRIDSVKRLQEECRRVVEEVAAAKQNLAKLNKKTHNYDVPPPKAYIQQKSQLDELRLCIKTWERKVEIAMMNLKSVKLQWRSMCAKQNAGSGDSNQSQMLSNSSGSKDSGPSNQKPSVFNMF